MKSSRNHLRHRPRTCWVPPKNIRTGHRPGFHPLIARPGTTLSEVLISLLIMSIGVVSLATLFPISVLRSVQATQLTNATNLRYNVEAMVNSMPLLTSLGSPWQSSTAYNQNAIVVPNQAQYISQQIVAVCTSAGTTGVTEPDWRSVISGNTINDGGATWQVFWLTNYIVDPQGEYIASFDDPTAMGRGPSAGPHFFGNQNGTPVSSIRAFAGVSFSSTAFGTPSTYDEYRASSLATLPDSWVLQAESNLVSYTAGATSCTLGGLKDDLTQNNVVPSPFLNGNPTPIPAGYAPSRIVFLDITGKVSHTRPIMGISGSIPNQTFDWSAQAGVIPFGPGAVVSMGPLPSNFTPVQARIETLDRRFTWMLCIRGSGSSMDVVVFFKRSFKGKDETVYPTTFQTGAIDPLNSVPANGQYSFYSSDPGYDNLPGIGNVDDDGINGTDDPGELGFPGSDDVPRNWIVLQFDGAAAEKPFYKKGSFVCDASGLRWYRIIDVIEGDAFNGFSPTSVMTKAGLNTASAYYTPDGVVSTFTTPRAVLLKFDRAIEQSSSVPSGGAGGAPTGGAILMRGVVEVFPIRSQQSWEN